MSKEPPAVWSGHESRGFLDTQVQYRSRLFAKRCVGWAVHVSSGYIDRVTVQVMQNRKIKGSRSWSFSSKKSSRSVVDLTDFQWHYGSTVIVSVWTKDGKYSSTAHTL